MVFEFQLLFAPIQIAFLTARGRMTVQSNSALSDRLKTTSNPLSQATKRTAAKKQMTPGVYGVALLVASVLSTPAIAESVIVKYRGLVDLSPFKCDEVSRSSFIHRVCYDAANQYMIILLQSTYYHYCEIDPATVGALMEAPSMGQFYNARIRGAPFDCRTHKVPQY
jgi:hypothetical protein